MITKVLPSKYIYPPRPKHCIPKDQADLFIDLGYKPQLKYNDSRTIIKIHPDQTIELWNRHAERFRAYTVPNWLIDQISETTKQIGLQPGKYHMLDGGLLDQKHKAIKDTIVIWDILVKDDQHLLGTTYLHRYQQLQARTKPWYFKEHQLGYAYTDNVFLAEYYQPDQSQQLWDLVETVNQPYPTPLLEGIVYKDPNGTLEMGYKSDNNTSWMVKSRVKTGRHRF